MRKWLNFLLSDLFIFVPFILAMGAALYFTLNNEPAIPCVTILTLGTLIAFAYLRRPIWLRAILLFLFGFLYAMTFTRFIETPQLPRDVRGAKINAIVSNIDWGADKPRLFLRVHASDIGVKNSDFVTVRVTISNEDSVPYIGDKITATAFLFRPNPADAPETFDMARWAYFNGISATGFVTDITVTGNTQYRGINSVRTYLHNRAKSALADSLVLGYKNAISKSDHTIWTNAGLGHVWAISGFHMALVGTWLFILFINIIRFIAPITRRVPAKNVALCMTCIGLAVYMLIAGGGASTLRAFLMTVLVTVALIFGRGAISLRNICIVFCLLFLVNPHCVMQAGFQLSFAAVFGLVWFWNDVNPKMPNGKMLRWLCVMGLTTVIATIFTAPFIILHFGNLPIYGVIGNIALLPVFSVLIMPLVMIGIPVACMGWNMPLDIASVVYDFTRDIAGAIAIMPGASISLSHFPNIAAITMLIGFIILISARPARAYLQYIIFGIMTTGAIIITAVYPRPVFMTTYDNALVAFATDNSIKFNKSRDSNHYFAFSTWKNLHNINPDTPNARYTHTNGVYKYSADGFNLVYIQKFVPLQNNIVRLCNDDKVDYIVSYLDVRAPHCNHKILRGGFVIYPSGRVRHTPTHRPWHHKSH